MLDPSRPDPLRSGLLDGSKRRFHGFFTRRGGMSDGIYASLNIGTGSQDDQARVAENRARVAAWMGVAPTHLLSVWQVHSPDVVTVSEPFSGERPKADALVTDRPGLAIGASTADCGPVLFADAQGGVIGAAHAGWKGAFTGVLENTIAAMERLGARRDDIKAVLGPTISQATTKSARSSRRASSRPTAPMAASSRHQTRRPQPVRHPRLYPRTAGARRCQGRSAAPLHLCGGERVLFLPPRHPSGRARLRPHDRGDRVGGALMALHFEKASSTPGAIASSSRWPSSSSTPCSCSRRKACTG
jgi:YfiH family protein